MNPCPEPEKVVMSYMKDGTPIYAEPEPVLYDEECLTVAAPTVLGVQDIIGVRGDDDGSRPGPGPGPDTEGPGPDTEGPGPDTEGPGRSTGQNNGFGNGDQSAPGNSLNNNGAENRPNPSNKGKSGEKGKRGENDNKGYDKNSSLYFLPFNEQEQYQDLAAEELLDLQFAQYPHGGEQQTGNAVVDGKSAMSYNVTFPTITSADTDVR